MDATRSTTTTRTLFPSLGMKKGARALWYSELSLHQLAPQPGGQHALAFYTKCVPPVGLGAVVPGIIVYVPTTFLNHTRYNRIRVLDSVLFKSQNYVLLVVWSRLASFLLVVTRLVTVFFKHVVERQIHLKKCLPWRLSIH